MFLCAHTLIHIWTHRVTTLRVFAKSPSILFVPTQPPLDSTTNLTQARMPVEATNPLQYMCGWDRTLSVTPRDIYAATVLAGYRTELSENDTKTEIEWFPPGQGGVVVPAGTCPWHANISGDFEYQIYIHDITDDVGTSGVEYNLYKAQGQVVDWTYPAGDFSDALR